MTPDAVPSALLVLGWLLLLRSMRHSGLGIAALSVAGTIGHELLHAAVGWLLGAKPASFSLMPKKSGDTWVLGSVSFTNITLWNAAPVAFAPLLLAGVAYLTFEHWTQAAYEAGQYVSWLLSGYVVACSLFACWPSATDLRIGAASGMLYAAVGYLLWWAAQ